MSRASFCGALFCALIAGSMIAQACNVPVFRYALEHWRPDPYRVTLLHRGPLTDAEREQLQPVLAAVDKSRINVVLRTVEVNEPADDADRQLFEKHARLPLPGLVVRYPEHLRIEGAVQSVALGLDAVSGLLESPVRRELVRRLADGETAVWLLLESGQKGADDATAAQLEDELRALEEKLKLPELTDAPDDRLLSNAPLRVAFSLLRVPRGDRAEEALVAMLLGCESDLAERTEAMLFPVFGRGRALLPLVGPGITPENIQSSASFLVGPCSCQVKDQNPGFDLLLAAEWESLLTTGEAPRVESPPASSPPAGEPELVEIPRGSAPAEEPTPVVVQDPGAAPSPATATAQRRSYIPQIFAALSLLLAAGCIAVARSGKGTAPGK